MVVVYLDSVFLLNTLVDYLLLLATAQLAGMPLQRRRLLLCALLGGFYAAVVLYPWAAWLGKYCFRLMMGGLLALLAFWQLQRRWHMVVLFYLVSGTLGGILLVLGMVTGNNQSLVGQLCFARISWAMLLGCTLVFYLLLRLLFHQIARHGGSELMRIKISMNGEEKELVALHDTGNTLRDPINGQPVLVVEREAIKGLWSRETGEIIDSAISAELAMAGLHSAGLGVGFTLLPFRSVGVSSGLLLATRSDYIKVGRATYPRAWVALSAGPISENGTYCALWGGGKRGDAYGMLAAENVSVDPQAQQAG